MSPLLEVCVDSVAGARIAEQSGADRIELCADLVEGGITPSIGTMRAVLSAVRQVGVQVLIRPRGGDFCYDDDETAVMLADIAAIRGLAAPSGVQVGFVIGALTPDGDVDVRVTAGLVRACGTAPVTFHKAFDFSADLPRSLDRLVELGVARVLTSGGQARAADAIDALTKLRERAAGRIGILAGGGVRPDNVVAIVRGTGVREVHLRAASTRPAPMRFWPDGMAIGSLGADYDRTRTVTSGEVVAQMRSALSAVDD